MYSLLTLSYHWNDYFVRKQGNWDQWESRHPLLHFCKYLAVWQRPIFWGWCGLFSNKGKYYLSKMFCPTCSSSLIFFFQVVCIQVNIGLLFIYFSFLKACRILLPMHSIFYLCLVSNVFAAFQPLPRHKLVQLLARYGVKNCSGKRRVERCSMP